MKGAAIEARGLTKRFGKTEALRGLDLTVQPGELYGLVGADAAGKTTTIRILAGLMSADAGSVRITGRDPIAEGHVVRERMGLMPQAHSIYGDLSVSENLRFFSRLFCLSRAEMKERSAQLLRITRLDRFPDRRADALSGGMYKKLALACALLHRPEVLFLDEPTNGVDPVSRRELWALLHEFLSEGMAIVVTTPYMDEAERCHRVGLIHGGRLLAEGTPRALLAGFRDEAWEIVGPRDAMEAAVHGVRGLHALSPAGGGLRAVISPGTAGALEAAVAPLGGTLKKSSPRFEDLFLARISGREAA